MPVGATLVRHSTPEGEVAETHTKAAGILAALGATSATTPAARPEAESPEIRAALAARNNDLARFWLDSREPGALTVPALAGRTALIVDGEDTFTAMLAHQLKALGLTVTVTPWTTFQSPAIDSLPRPLALDPETADPRPADPRPADPLTADLLAADLLAADPLAADPLAADLLVAGPGPGDPGDPDDPKMAVMRGLIEARLAAGRPLFAVCLGHEILAVLLGLALRRRDAPYQGLARDIDLFGETRRVGFYSSFAAVSDTDDLTTPHGEVQISRDRADAAVHALRGPRFAGVQFHPESVLSRDGLTVLAELLPQLLSDVVSPAKNG